MPILVKVLMSGYTLTFVVYMSDYTLNIMKKNKLQIEQLESKIKLLEPLTHVVMPPTGWIKAIRSALGISLQQFANKLSISRQSASEIEQREKDGSITIKSLKEAARALDLKVVYGLVPNDGSLDALIERKALELARKIVNRTSTTMELENQANSSERIENAIKERAQSLKFEIPKFLWD